MSRKIECGRTTPVVRIENLRQHFFAAMGNQRNYSEAQILPFTDYMGLGPPIDDELNPLQSSLRRQQLRRSHRSMGRYRLGDLAAR